MPTPPEGFLEDFERMHTHIQWARPNMTSGSPDIPQSKMIIEEWQEFVAKYLHRIEEEEVADGIRRADKFIQAIRQELERLRRAHLKSVLAARREWHLSELIFEGVVQCGEIVKLTPPSLLPKLMKVLNDSGGGDFDAAKEYREAEADAEEAEAEYKQALARYKCDWPECYSETLRKRLSSLTNDDFESTDEELLKIILQQEQQSKQPSPP